MRTLLPFGFIAGFLVFSLSGCAPQKRPAAGPIPHTAADLSVYLETVMTHYDLNHDDRLSEDEFARAAMAMFESIDADADDALDQAEMGERWNTNCSLADTNGDKTLSLMEVLRDQNDRFKGNDANRDGFLDRVELHNLLEYKFKHVEGRK